MFMRDYGTNPSSSVSATSEPTRTATTRKASTPTFVSPRETISNRRMKVSLRSERRIVTSVMMILLGMLMSALNLSSWDGRIGTLVLFNPVQALLTGQPRRMGNGKLLEFRPPIGCVQLAKSHGHSASATTMMLINQESLPFGRGLPFFSKNGGRGGVYGRGNDHSTNVDPLHARSCQQHQQRQRRRGDISCWAVPDPSTMSASEMRAELESYGISTRTFLERQELRQALEEARTNRSSSGKDDGTTATSTVNGDMGNNPNTSTSTKSRTERIQEEQQKAAKLSVAQLKKELQERGISTRSFFEKSEFLRAYAEAIVDGMSQSTASSNGGRDGTSNRRTTARNEEYDPSYRDVSVQKFNGRDASRLQGTIIDISVR